MSATKFRSLLTSLALIASLARSATAQADGEVHSPHRLMSGRILEIVTNFETRYIGWVLKDRSQQQLSFGDFKDISFNDPKLNFENPLGWDVHIDVAALKFSNGRQLILFVKDHILKRGPEIVPGAQGTRDVHKDFDFKLLRKEKKIRVMNHDDPKNPEVAKTYRWNGTGFSD